MISYCGGQHGSKSARMACRSEFSLIPVLRLLRRMSRDKLNEITVS